VAAPPSTFETEPAPAAPEPAGADLDWPSILPAAVDQVAEEEAPPEQATAPSPPLPVPVPDDEPGEDLMYEWDVDQPTSDAAPTESIALPASAPIDTAVLAPPPEPYLPPGQGPPGPAAAPAAIPPAASEAPSARSRPFPWGASFALLGAVAVILSSILPWEGPFEGSLPRDIPARVLLDPEGPASGISLGILLLFMGTIGALMALVTMAVPFLKFARRLVGLASLAIPAVFVFRTFQLAVTDGALLDLPGLIGTGVYVAAVGSLVELFAGKWFAR
jgi:hypothetical protein